MWHYLNCRHTSIQYDYKCNKCYKTQMSYVVISPLDNFVGYPNHELNESFKKSWSLFFVVGTSTMNEPQGLEIWKTIEL